MADLENIKLSPTIAGDGRKFVAQLTQTLQDIVKAIPSGNQPVISWQVKDLSADEVWQDIGGTVTNSLIVSFDPSEVPDYVYSELYFVSDDGEGSYSFIDIAETQLIIPDVTAGRKYNILVIAVNKYGIKSDFLTSPVVSLTVLGQREYISTPKNFAAFFDRNGLTIKWDHVSDTDFAGYEIRSDMNAGDDLNRLAETANNVAQVRPSSRNGLLYLFAKNNIGYYSAPAILNYHKPLPAAPANLTISKVPEGSLIQFSKVPDDCIGANLYLDDTHHTLTESGFLYTGIENIGSLKVCFYDSFGEGTPAWLALAVPADVTAFDGVISGEYIDFKWNPVPGMGMAYILRRGTSWELGEVVANTLHTSCRLLFPVSGSHTFWIKAIDQFENYSANPAFLLMDMPKPVNRNVVLYIDQVYRGWEGSKANVHVSDSGLRLDDKTVRGEHIVSVNLPKPYLARNWINSTMIGVGQEIKWCDATFPWNSLEARSAWQPNGDISNATLKHEIALYRGIPDSILEYLSLDQSLAGRVSTVMDQHKVGFGDGRFAKGVALTDVSRLSWSLDIPAVFNSIFYLNLTSGLPDYAVFYTLMGPNGFMYLGFDPQRHVFYLKDNLGNCLAIDLDFRSYDALSFGIVQTETERKLYAYSFSTNTVASSVEQIAPVGSWSAVFLSPKYEIIGG